MSTLVLQIIIKQWDKSQQSEYDQNARSMMPDRYLLTFPPAQYLFDKNLVFAQYGDDIQGNRIDYGITKNGQLKIDRFLINLSNKTLEYQAESEPTIMRQLIGSIDNNWIQSKYSWRYSVYQDGFYYWLYEEITLNSVYLEAFNEKFFIESEPAIIFTDFDSSL